MRIDGTSLGGTGGCTGPITLTQSLPKAKQLEHSRALRGSSPGIRVWAYIRYTGPKWFQLGSTGVQYSRLEVLMVPFDSLVTDYPHGWYHVYVDNPHGRTNAVVDICKLADVLPHGSGFDGDWRIVVNRNGDVTCRSEYHAMNKNGYYCGWRNFRFSIRQHRSTNRIVELQGPCLGQFQVTHVKGHVYFTAFVGGGDASDYLHDTCYWAVSEALNIHSMENAPTQHSRESALAYR